MAHIIFWSSTDGDLETVLLLKKFKRMNSSIDDSGSSYVFDCLEAAEAAGRVFGKHLQIAIKNGNQYIDLSQPRAMIKFLALSFDCVTQVFSNKDWSDSIEVFL